MLKFVQIFLISISTVMLLRSKQVKMDGKSRIGEQKMQPLQSSRHILHRSN